MTTDTLARTTLVVQMTAWSRSNAPAGWSFRRLARDTLVALIALGLTLGMLMGAHTAARRALDAPGVALAVVACLPLIAHRRWPLSVLALTTAASATLNGLGYALGPPFGPTIALFYVASDERTRGRLRDTAAVLVGVFALHVTVTAITRGSPAVSILAGIVVWSAAWMIGDQVRQRRGRRAELVERARRAERELDRERRLAVAEERTRIARDLHDSAAHAINVILVQAGAARLLGARDREATEQALSTIEAIARETIADIEHLVGELRDDRTDTAIEPPTGLAALQTLAERHRAAGLEVDLTTTGHPRVLAPGLDQAAYRIVQESLTNAARHGGGPAEVVVAYGSHELELTVANRMAVTADVGGRDGHLNGGHGILGMRERAALLGGTLEAGRSNGGFRVQARLPYAAESRT
jgi:signal transduction histidine kinase